MPDPIPRLGLIIRQPRKNEEVALGVDFNVSGTVSGTRGAVPNPLDSVTVQLNAEPPVNALLLTGPGRTVSFRATVRLNAPGEHLITVTATAEYGSIRRTVVVATLGTPFCRAEVPWMNYPRTQSITSRSTCRPESLAGLVSAIRDAEAAQVRVHAFGSKWSFSDCALTGDRLIDMTHLNRELRTVQSALRPGQSMPLYHVEAGITIRQLCENLGQRGLALETMGGASGQTLAGAISTGTHGGDKFMPPLADSVLAIHLVGTGGTQFWIEPSAGITEPELLRANVVPGVDPQNIIYDDITFEACLVSLGCMGVIYAVVLRVRPAYDLIETTVQTTWQEFQLRAVNLLNDPDFRFLQLLLNPYRDEDDANLCLLTTRAEAALTGPGQRPKADTSLPIFRAIISAAADLTALYMNGTFDVDRSEEQRMARLVQGVLTYVPVLRQVLVQSYGAILSARFPPGTFQGASYSVMDLGYGDPLRQSQPGYSIELSFPAVDESGQLGFVQFVDELIATVNAATDTFLTGYISLRFSGRTRAFLGMQQWRQTCSVEIATVQGVQGHQELLRRIYESAFKYGGLPHWGQMIDFSPFVQGHGRLYSRYSQWRDVYARMSNNFTAQTFENDLSVRWHLTTASTTVTPIILTEVAAGRLPDRRLQLWVTDAAGLVLTAWKETPSPNAQWTLWSDFADEVGPVLAGARQVTAAALPDGRLQLWMTDGAGGLLTTWKTSPAPNAPWVAWSDFLAEVGAIPTGVAQVAVGRLPDGRLELWAVDRAGGLFTSWKTNSSANAPWAGWADFIAEAGAVPAGVVQVAVAPLPDGRLELWATDGAGGLFTTWKLITNPNAGWTPWSDFLGEAGEIQAGVARVAVARLPDQRLELWVTDRAGALLTSWKLTADPNADWVPWADFLAEAGAIPAGVSQVAVAALSDERLQLWTVDRAGGLFTTWKLATAPNAGWTPWTNFLGEVVLWR